MMQYGSSSSKRLQLSQVMQYGNTMYVDGNAHHCSTASQAELITMPKTASIPERADGRYTCTVYADNTHDNLAGGLHMSNAIVHKVASLHGTAAHAALRTTPG